MAVELVAEESVTVGEPVFVEGASPHSTFAFVFEGGAAVLEHGT